MKKLLLFAFAIFLSGSMMAQFTATFTVDLTEVEGFNADTTEIFMAGDFLGWNEPGTNPDYKMMATEENPLIYTKTFDFPAGDTTVQYKYFFVFNGAAGWANGEWTGEDNRKITVRETITLNDIWADRPSVVSFTVDLSSAADSVFNVETDEIYLAGSINLPHGWVTPGEMSNMKMMPVEGSLMYTLDISLYNGDYEYKYFTVTNGEPSWNGGEWEGGDNRAITVDTTMAVEDYWASLTAINDPVAGPITSVYPNPCTSTLNVTFFENNNDINKIEIYNIVGAVVKTVEGFNSQTVTINTNELTSGVYMIAVHNSQGVQTTKFVKE